MQGIFYYQVFNQDFLFATFRSLSLFDVWSERWPPPLLTPFAFCASRWSLKALSAVVVPCCPFKF